jgi:hypothetical protein
MGEPVMTEEPYVEDEADVEAAVAAEAGGHLRPETFLNRQTVDLDIDFVGSPVDFNEGTADTVYRLAPHLPKHLKVNMADKDRHLAGDEHLAGNLRRMVPLEFEILQQANTLPYFAGIQCEHMMSRNLHRHGNVLHRVPPNTPTMKYNEKVFEPVSVIDRKMYDEFVVQTPEMVEASIREVPATKSKPAYANVDVGTLAHDTIKHNLKKGAWKDVPLSESQLRAIFKPKSHVRAVEVPIDIARPVKERLLQEARDVEARCVNAEDLTFTLVRADGIDGFKTVDNLHGQMIGSKAESVDALATQLITKRGMFHVKARLTYILL